MNEIFVEEENTVYELDSECLKRKEEQKQQEKECHRMQKMSRRENRNDLWILLLVLLIGCK